MRAELKTPDWTQVVRAALRELFLVAIEKVLVQQKASSGLSGGNVIVLHETSESLQVVEHQFHLTK